MKRNAIVTALTVLAMITLVTVVYIKMKSVTVVIDGVPTKYKTFKNTVGEVLQSEKIPLGKKDKISIAANKTIKDKDVINIKRAINVTVHVDDKDLKLASSEDNVEQLLATEGVTLNTDDKITPDKVTKLSKDLTVNIVRVDKKIFTDSTDIEYNTEIKYDNDLANSVKKVVQDGKNGQQEVQTRVTYEDNKEVNREVISSKVVSNPVNKIIVMGTLPVLPISRGGDPVPYTKTFQVRATAYSAHPTGTTYTASGRKAVRDSNGYSTIAVDPNVIPLGTRLFVQGYGFAIAADTGSAILGNTIDVYFNTYSESCNWAVKYVNVYILK